MAKTQLQNSVAIYNCLVKLNQAREKLLLALSQLETAAQIADSFDQQLGGEIRSYTVGNIEAFTSDDPAIMKNQSGNLSAMATRLEKIWDTLNNGNTE